MSEDRQNRSMLLGNPIPGPSVARSSKGKQVPDAHTRAVGVSVCRLVLPVPQESTEPMGSDSASKQDTAQTPFVLYRSYFCF